MTKDSDTTLTRDKLASLLEGRSTMADAHLLTTLFRDSSIGWSIRFIKTHEYICNEAHQRMTGFTQDELRNLDVRTLNHPDEQEVNDAFREKLRTHELDHYRSIRRRRHKDGHYVWLINEAFAFFDDDGNLDLVLYLNQDISALKQAEEEAEQKSELIETTIDTMAQGYAVYDSEMCLVRYNAQFEELFSFPKNFLYEGMSFREITKFRAHRGDYKNTYSGSEEKIAADRFRDASIPAERSREHTLPTGRTYIHHRKSMADGGCVTTYTDITEYKKTQQEAAEKTAILQNIFDNMAQGVAVYNSDNILTAFNEQFPRISGLPDGLMRLGMHRGETIRDRIQLGLVQEGSEDERLFDRQRRHREQHLPDGRTYIYERIPTADGGNIMTATDITDLKAAEERLHQAQKMEAVGQLTGGIAHDFNNMLAIIIGNLELCQEALAQGGDKEGITNRLEAMARAGARGAELTQRLLAFSRRQSLQPRIINANTAVNGMADLMRRTLGETIEIRISAESNIWNCAVDPGQLENALLNLAINARDAMGRGGILSVETTNVSLQRSDIQGLEDVTPGEYVMIRVADTGAGMTQEVIAHAIEPFFTTKGVGQGSGLGLSMVYGFIRQSGGHMVIDSKPGEGTSIRLYLPRANTESDEAADDRKAPDAVLPLSNGETIMVVEDDPSVRAMTVNMLHSLGYETTTAGDGAEAIKRLQSGPAPDLLFTDIVLPKGMNGMEVAEEAQKIIPGLKVLYASGYPDSMNPGKKNVQAGVTLLAKPYRREQLARTLRGLLD